jgi:AcrR family transcriptional regulator
MVGSGEADGAGDRDWKYDSPRRREQVAAMRERIVVAGCELLHGFPVWNWSALTVPAVAEHAGIASRTVYRYFPSERDLRDAVMVRLEREADVVLEGLELADVAEVAARIIRHSSTFQIVPRVSPDESVAAANARQREALLTAIKPLTPDWSERERRIAGGILDVLWSVVAYERLVTDWDLDLSDAVAGTTWVIGLVEAAIRADRPPEEPS